MTTPPPVLANPHATTLEDSATRSRVTYHPGYIAASEADALLSWALASVPWKTETPVIFGKAREVRRRTCAFGTPGLSYRYSGKTETALAWPLELTQIISRLSADIGAAFNFGFCNLYPDGDAAIGKHADAEPEIVRDSPIVGLSLGAERDFVLYDRADRRVAEVTLGHGSIVVMWGATQRHYKHAVPPRKRVREPRVNVTFRVFGA